VSRAGDGPEDNEQARMAFYARPLNTIDDASDAQ